MKRVPVSARSIILGADDARTSKKRRQGRGGRWFGGLLVRVEELLECGHTILWTPDDWMRASSVPRDCHFCDGRPVRTIGVPWFARTPIPDHSCGAAADAGDGDSDIDIDATDHFCCYLCGRSIDDHGTMVLDERNGAMQPFCDVMCAETAKA